MAKKAENTLVEAMQPPVVTAPYNDGPGVTQEAELIITLKTPMAHNDPAVGDTGNTKPFNRALQFVDAPKDDGATSDHPLRELEVPEEMALILGHATVSQVLASLILKQFIALYSTQDGAGLFVDVDRYSMLAKKASSAAATARTLSDFWDRLLTAMQVPLRSGNTESGKFVGLSDHRFLTLINAPDWLQRDALGVLRSHLPTTLSIARAWHRMDKDGDGGDPVTVTPRSERLGASVGPDGKITMDVPFFQTNGFRNRALRSAGAMHMFSILGIYEAMPGQGQLPAGVEAIFENGGNIAQGVKGPSNTHGHCYNVRRTFPLLDAVGGCLDWDTLGESRVIASIWPVAAEYAAALKGTPAEECPEIRTSMFDRIDDTVQTRHESRQGRGAMIQGCETLAAGSKFYARIVLRPHTPTLTKGAVVAALDYWIANNPTLGGQARVGFGWCDVEWKTRFPDQEEAKAAYEDFLRQNREYLVEQLTSGHMGSTIPVLT